MSREEENMLKCVRVCSCTHVFVLFEMMIICCISFNVRKLINASCIISFPLHINIFLRHPLSYVPCCTKYARMFLRMTMSLSVPKWGLPSTRILSGAPWVTRDSRMERTSALFLPVVLGGLHSRQIR